MAARNTRIGLRLATLLVVFGAPSALAEEPKPFSHKYHIDEEGAGCKDCHDAASGKQLPSLNKQACIDCHDEVPAFVPPVRAKRLPIKFPHAKHVDAAECLDCHKAVVDGTQKASEPVLNFAKCGSCHEESGIELSDSKCAACHGVDQRRVKPADHAVTWKSRHGQAAEWRVFDQHGQDCKTCHQQDACASCHKSERPRSHTALWRMRTHGVAAEWDRDTCKTCHESGTCVQCHKSNSPLNHRGGWIARHGLTAETKTDAKCGTCHASAECVACHSGELR